MLSVNPFLVLAGIFLVIMIAKAIVIVPENHRGAVERLGSYLKALQPGMHVVIPTLDVVKMIDLDATVPGWQGMTEAQLAAGIRNLHLFGTLTPSTGLGNRPIFADSTSDVRDEQALSTWLVKKASEQTGVDLSMDPLARSRLIEMAQKAVKALDSSSSFDIHLPFLAADRSGPKHFSLSLTKSQLSEIVGPRRS